MSEVEPETFTNFIEVNGTWVITFTGILSACVSGTLVYFLRSRCTQIKCFCFECKRIPITEDNINSVSLGVNNI
jgi:hypothetical protein